MAGSKEGRVLARGRMLYLWLTLSSGRIDCGTLVISGRMDGATVRVKRLRAGKKEDIDVLYALLIR